MQYYCKCSGVIAIMHHAYYMIAYLHYFGKLIIGLLGLFFRYLPSPLEAVDLYVQFFVLHFATHDFDDFLGKYCGQRALRGEKDDCVGLVVERTGAAGGY